MESIINMICNGETALTAPVVVGLLVFSMVLEAIGTIAYAITSMGRR